MEQSPRLARHPTHHDGTRCFDPPPILLFHASPTERRARIARLAVATVGSLAGAVVMRSWEDHVPRALWIPTALLVVSAALAHHAAAGSQLIARSVWWANLILSTLLSMAGSGRERALGLVLALGTGGALLAMGRLGLDDDDESAFRPVAFRTTLTLGMIMAVADAQGLTLFGALALDDGGTDMRWQGALLLGSAALLVVAIVGLYRLRFWGLLLAAVRAIVVGALALTGTYGVKGALNAAFVITSAVQILLPIPIVIAIVRRRAPAPTTSPSRLARLAPAMVVTLMMAASAITVGLVGHAVLH